MATAAMRGLIISSMSYMVNCVRQSERAVSIDNVKQYVAAIGAFSKDFKSQPFASGARPGVHGLDVYVGVGVLQRSGDVIETGSRVCDRARNVRAQKPVVQLHYEPRLSAPARTLEEQVLAATYALENIRPQLVDAGVHGGLSASQARNAHLGGRVIITFAGAARGALVRGAQCERA